MQIELEFVENGAIMNYPEYDIKFVVSGENDAIARDLGNDILAEIADKFGDKTKFKIEVNITPI